MSDATPVAPSATDPTPVSASDQALAAGDFAGFRAARLAERTGKPLDPVPADPPAEPAPAQPGDQAASTDATPPPASEPGKPATGHKGNAETRKAELQREINDLLAQRARLRDETRTPQPPQPADSAPAPSSPSPAKPVLADFEADPDTYPDPYAAWVEAVADWRATQILEAREAKQRQETEARQRVESERSRIETFRSRVQAVETETPGFWDGLSAEVKELRTLSQAQAAGVRPTPLNAVAEELLDCENPAVLMRRWTEHPEDLRALERASGPRALLIEFGRQLERATAKPAPKPPAKTVSDAPPPPTTLGSRPAAPVEALEAAANAGDFDAFKRERQRARVASLR